MEDAEDGDSDTDGDGDRRMVGDEEASADGDSEDDQGPQADQGSRFRGRGRRAWGVRLGLRVIAVLFFMQT